MYFKNQNGFDGLSGATIQVTKNYKTLGEMLGDEGTVFRTSECLGFIDVGNGCWRQHMLATSLKDGDGFGRFRRYHLSLNISVGDQHSKNITYIHFSTMNELFEKPHKDLFEINQSLNSKGKIAPLRDTFYIKLSGESIR